MANKPQDTSQSENAPAVDDVRTKKELDAAAEKRHAEADLAEAKAHHGASSSIHGHVKKHERDELDPVQSPSDEPVIEDEP